MNKSNWQLDRRFVLKAGTFGIAALGLPGFAYSYQAQTGFTHGVASGEPQADSVLLWTRFVSTGTAQLTVELSETIDFSAVKAGGLCLGYIFLFQYAVRPFQCLCPCG